MSQPLVHDVSQLNFAPYSIYHGAVLEDPNTLFLLVGKLDAIQCHVAWKTILTISLLVWETLEAHHALINDKEVYAKLAAEVSKCADVTKLELFHIHANAELASVINAPFTSFAHITALKPGVSASEVEVQLDALTKLKNETGKHGGVWGKVVEKDGQLALYGWDDPKVRSDFYASTPQTYL